MTSDDIPPENPTIPSEAIPTEVVLLREIQRRLGIMKDDERNFLIETSGYINTDHWNETHYNAFSQLFHDYVFCLDIIGPAARQIGLRVSIALSLFTNPGASITHGSMKMHLAEILAMNPYSRP